MNPWRIAIDERTGRPRGEPQPVGLPTSWSGQISLSANGRRLVYRTSEMTAEIRRVPFDAAAGRVTGPTERMLETAIPAVGLDISADGWIVFRTAAMQEDVYVMHVDGSGTAQAHRRRGQGPEPGLVSGRHPGGVLLEPQRTLRDLDRRPRRQRPPPAHRDRGGRALPGIARLALLPDVVARWPVDRRLDE